MYIITYLSIFLYMMLCYIFPLIVTNAFTIFFVLLFPIFCFILTIMLYDTFFLAEEFYRALDFHSNNKFPHPSPCMGPFNTKSSTRDPEL